MLKVPYRSKRTTRVDNHFDEVLFIECTSGKSTNIIHCRRCRIMNVLYISSSHLVWWACSIISGLLCLVLIGCYAWQSKTMRIFSLRVVLMVQWEYGDWGQERWSTLCMDTLWVPATSLLHKARLIILPTIGISSVSPQRGVWCTSFYGRNMLISGSSDCTVRVWNFRTGACERWAYIIHSTV